MKGKRRRDNNVNLGILEGLFYGEDFQGVV